MIEIDSELKEFIKLGGFVGLAQINPIAGNLEYNSNKISEFIEQASLLDLDIIAFPKNALLGFEMKDFIDRYPFILVESKKWLEKIAQKCTKISALIGFYDEDKNQAYAILRSGKIDKILKNCEYITSKEFHDGVEFLIKPEAIPSRAGSQIKREEALKQLAIKTKRPILEVNQVGSIDCWSYSGQSLACDENGEIFARAKDFEEQLLIVNPFRKIGGKYSDYPKEAPNSFVLDYSWDLERTYKSIVQSIRDYFTKCGLKRAVLGLSGGLDSTVCAVLLTDALGKENVFGVSMPSKLTSDESKSDAEILAKNLGIGFAEAPIKEMYKTTDDCFQNLFKEVETKWNCRYKESFTSDNIQARSRAMYLFGIANEFASCIPIATSDKSELYMGYATINGDMSGGFAPIADVTKTKLFALARWMNENRMKKNAIPESIILKRPGAELAIDPNTGKTLCAEDALMPYEFLDEIIWRIENWNESYSDLMKAEFIYEKKMNISKEQKQEWLNKFYRRMSFALFKGVIMPPSPIVDSHSINKVDYFQPVTSSSINYGIS
ncbi:NAD(+) synthase [bacterium]|nr:NAD(+) synthase [bacterium]